MNNEQVEMLKALVKGEIEAALQNESGYRCAYELEKQNREGWETFLKSFEVK